MAKLPRGQLAHVTPEVLSWARERARLDLDLVAAQLKIDPNVLIGWESGSLRPTVSQLRHISEIYKRPPAIFFLDAPPQDFSVMEEYRIHRLSANESSSKALSIEASLAQERRLSVLDVAEDMGEEFSNFPLKASLNTPIESLARSVREHMGLSLHDQINWNSTEEALKHWLRAVESLDVLVFQSSKFNPLEARGFSMFFELLPIILINGKDAPAGKIFTLLHELVHLIIINGDPNLMVLEANRDKKQNRDIERFCNDAASEIMMPNRIFVAHPVVQNLNDSNISFGNLSTISKYFSVSRDAVLLRLRKLRIISDDTYEQFQSVIDREYQDLLDKRKEDRKGKKGGPMPHTMALRDLGTTYTRVVLEALSDSVISTSTASGLLNLKVKHFDNLSHALIKKMSKEAS